MKLLKLVFLLLLMTGVYAKGSKWQKLKSLDRYPGSAYHLKENVAYMEIRWYSTNKGKKPTKTLKLYRKPLESYPDEIVSKFRLLKPKYSNSADISGFGNAFFIDTKGKMYQMDMKKDIISLLGTIDRLAEVELVLYLNYVEGRHYFKKTSKGYRVKIVQSLKECTGMVQQGNVDTSGKYTYKFRYNLQRKGCKKRKHTRFIHNKKVNYQSYIKIVLDEKGNLYVLGKVKKSKFDDNYNVFYVLEKYNGRGRRIWSKKLATDEFDGLSVRGGSIYLLNNKKTKAVFSFNGKKKSLKNTNIIKAANDVTHVKYFPEGLPNKKEAIDFYLSDYVKDKEGSIYIVGSEVFYPSVSPDKVPEGECGNVEEVLGALVAKLDSKGKTVWAKVIDRND